MSTVEEILDAARALGPAEQAELKRRLDVLTTSEENGGRPAEAGPNQDQKAINERIHQAMYEAGLVSAISPSVKRRRERPPPIKIKGKPLSETIIEDRR
jgi:hypothetical protein